MIEFPYKEPWKNHMQKQLHSLLAYLVSMSVNDFKAKAMSLQLWTQAPNSHLLASVWTVMGSSCWKYCSAMLWVLVGMNFNAWKAKFVSSSKEVLFNFNSSYRGIAWWERFGTNCHSYIKCLELLGIWLGWHLSDSLNFLEVRAHALSTEYGSIKSYLWAPDLACAAVKLWVNFCWQLS